MKLEPGESLLKCGLSFVNGEIREDDVCHRIRWLINEYLVEIDSDDSGWFKLYQDPESGEFWELSYPQSYNHGGGPQQLTKVSIEDVKSRYINK